MKIFFDTSVLVSAVVDQLPRHAAAHAALLNYTTGDHLACCTTHVLAETYATLTALPLARRIHPEEARQIIETNFMARVTLLPLDEADYAHALQRVARLGLSSGIIYDALHLRAAETAACERFYTYNLTHFHRLQPQGLMVMQP